jgi:hypothetical protein
VTDPQASLDALSEQVHGDLAGRLTAWEDGYMLTKYLTVAEVIGRDGMRSVLLVTSREMKSWETLGMLGYAAQLEQAETVRTIGDE